MTNKHFLPPEIHESIIDQSQDDRKLLFTCALVCRDWLERSRPHSFRVITIQTRRHVYNLRDVFSLNRELSALVRSILIQPSQSDPRFLIPSLFDLTASTLLPFLVNLCAWSLWSHENKRSNSGDYPFLRRPAIQLFKQAHIKHGANVNTLHLHRSTFTSHADLLRIALSVPGLRHLRCSGITFRQSVAGGDFPPSATWKLPLLSLQVSSMKEDGIVMLLGAAQMTLNDLAIEMPPIEDIDRLPSVLSQLPHVSSLTLQQPPRSSADSKWSDLPWSNGEDPLSKFARCSSRLLEGPPPSIEQLVLQLTQPTTEELNASLHIDPNTTGPFPKLAAILLRLARVVGRVELLVANARRDRLQFWKTQLAGRHFPDLFNTQSFDLRCITTSDWQGSFVSGHEGPVTRLSISPDGTVVATGSKDGTIILWDVQSRRIVGEWIAHRGVVHPVGFSPDGVRLVSTSTSGADSGSELCVRIWNVPYGTMSGAFASRIRDEVDTMFPRPLTTWSPRAIWSPDGTMLVVDAYAEGCIESQPNRFAKGLAIWNTSTSTSTCILRDSHHFPLTSAFFPGERWFKSGADGGLWSPSTFAPTGKYIAASTSSAPSWSIGVWDMVSGESIVCLRTSDVLGAASGSGPLQYIVTFSPDGMRMLSEVNSPQFLVHEFKFCTGYKVPLRLEREDWFRGRWIVTLAALFSPNGEYIATTSAQGDGRVVNHLWEASTGLCVGSLPLDPCAKRTLTFTPHGDLCYVPQTGNFSIVRFRDIIDNSPNSWSKAGSASAIVGEITTYSTTLWDTSSERPSLFNT